MQRPASTVLITGAGSGLGLQLVQRCLQRFRTVIAATRAPHPDLLALRGPGLHCLPLDVADESSLRELRLHLQAAHPPIDLLIHHASLRQILSLDRLDPRAPAGPAAFQMLAALRVTYALLDCLADHALVACLASRSAAATEFGSLRRPPRTSPAALGKALRGLAVDLHGRHAALAVLWLAPGGTFGESHLDGTADWVLTAIDHLSGHLFGHLSGPLPPQPVWLRQRSRRAK